MAVTKRKDIVNEQLYRFGLISGINTVTRWRDTDAEPFTLEECPALNIKDGKAQVNTDVSYDTHELAVTIELHTTSAITADEAEAILGDITECIEANDTWGNAKADGTNVESHDINIQQAGDTITAATLEITVKYTTDRGKI
jgi:hypothetical protein